MTVQRLLNEKGDAIFSIPSDTHVRTICTELTHRGIGALVVVDRDTLVGIVSERDVVHALHRHGESAMSMTAAEIMTRAVETCRPEERVAEVMQRMTQGRFRHLPVVVNERLVGVISIGDVVKQRIAEAEQEAAEIREYIATI